jgi:hypothetical protein
MVLGDSFAWGYAVNDHKAFAAGVLVPANGGREPRRHCRLMGTSPGTQPQRKRPVLTVLPA